MEDKEIKFGIQECSKCRYKLRCDECIYNDKDIREIMDDRCKKEVEKVLDLAEAHNNGFESDMERFINHLKEIYNIEE